MRKNFNTIMDNKNLIVTMAMHIITTKDTIRATSLLYNIPKSTLYTCMIKYLPCINNNLYEEVVEVFSYNKSMRSYRGGLATQNLYKNKNKKG